LMEGIHRQQGDLISLFSFLKNEKSRLKMKWKLIKVSSNKICGSVEQAYVEDSIYGFM
jgi:hypothetical protein